MFEKLAAVTGYEWWIDYRKKDIHLNQKDAVSASRDYNRFK